MRLLKGFFILLFSSMVISANAANLKVNGINMYYEIHGKNTSSPLVLIAGFTCDHTFWAGILEQLSANHQVLIFDNRGVGQTETPDSPYSIDMMADDAMALIKELKLKNPVIIGQSMGSAIAQSIGKRYSNQVSKIVLMNTFDHINKAPEIAFENMGELLRLNLPMKYRVQASAPWVFSSEFLSQPDQLAHLIKFAEDNPHPQSLIGFEHQLNAIKAFHSKPWLQDIKSPALIIAGQEDIIAPLAAAKEVQKGIGRKTKLVILPGGHGSPIEQPEKVTQAILNFI